MVLAIFTLTALALATMREMVLRAIPVAVGLAALFALVRSDAGPMLTFGGALAAWAFGRVAQEALLTSPVRAVRAGSGVICGGASIWVAAQLALSLSHFATPLGH